MIGVVKDDLTWILEWIIGVLVSVLGFVVGRLLLQTSLRDQIDQRVDLAFGRFMLLDKEADEARMDVLRVEIRSVKETVTNAIDRFADDIAKLREVIERQQSHP